MATIKYYPAIPSDMLFPPQEGTLLDHDETSAEFMTRAVGDTKLFSGHDFVYENDTLVGGTVTEIVYRTSELDYYRVTDFEWNVADGEPALFGGDDLFIGSRVGEYLYAEAGNDRIRGGKGDDYVRGGEGDDILRGGMGSDHFVFFIGDGSDTIRGFDTTGRSQDVIHLKDLEDISQLDISQQGRNVVIEYGEGDRITLHDVDLEDLAPSNFGFG